MLVGPKLLKGASRLGEKSLKSQHSLGSTKRSRSKENRPIVTSELKASRRSPLAAAASDKPARSRLAQGRKKMSRPYVFCDKKNEKEFRMPSAFERSCRQLSKNTRLAPLRHQRTASAYQSKSQSTSPTALRSRPTSQLGGNKRRTPSRGTMHSLLTAMD